MLLWVWILAAGIVVARLVDIQVIRRGTFMARATGQQERRIVLQARRGGITDRNGIDLAVSLPAPSVAINPRRVSNPAWLAPRISAITGEPVSQVQRRISARRRAFAWVARSVDQDDAQRLRALAPEAMMVLEGTRRTHPLGTLAGQVIGHVDIDNQGGDGIEEHADATLRGRDGWIISLVDARGDRVPNTAQPIEEPTNGASLVLTLDADYQAIVEHELSVAVEATRAWGGMAILYEAKTGAIRAMANVPQYNPDSYRAADASLRRNRAITDPYEPGSMFKAVTAAVALAEQVVRPDEPINCQNGSIVVGGQVIRDAHPSGVLRFRDVIARSSNVGTIKVGTRLEPSTFYRYIRSFGFGAETGVDLPGESKGILARLSRWSGRSQATICIGQEIGVTALQQAAAYGAIANGGWLMRPHLVERVVGPDARAPVVEPRRVRQVMSTGVADLMVDLLCGVVEEGTGTTARIAGLRVAGKTGTAQIASPDGKGYLPGAYMASFAGFLPEMSPRLVCVVSIVRPQTTYYGATVAAPVFKSIMGRIVNRDAAIVHSDSSAGAAMMPNLAGESRERAIRILDSLGVAAHTVGAGETVIGQWPPASTRTPANSAVELVLSDRRAAGPGLPDVRGMTVRQAVAMLSAAGVPVRLSGSGVVVAQDPAPGSARAKNLTMTLRCEQRDWSAAPGRTE